MARDLCSAVVPDNLVDLEEAGQLREQFRLILFEGADASLSFSLADRRRTETNKAAEAIAAANV